MIGTQITQFVLPLLAVLSFQADPLQVGLLSTAGYLPYLFLSLFAGVWVDHWQRRLVLIVSNLASALALTSIPVAAVFQVLTLEQLYLVNFLTGVATVFYQVAYFAYLPALVQPEDLAEANTKMELSYSIAIVSGPGIAGILVQIIAVPATILIDVFSFLVSTFNLLRIKTREKPIRPTQENHNIWQGIWSGLRLIIHNPFLRAIASSTAMNVFFRVAIGSQFILYAVRDLKIEPGLLGIIRAMGSFGPLAGSLVVGYLTGRLGVGRSLIWVKFVGDLAYLLIPLAFGPIWLIFPVLLISQFMTSFVIPIYNANIATIQQTITPPELKGRISASNRFLSWSTIPLGTLLGGIFGGIIGLQPTLLIASAGISFSFLWLYFSPIRHLQDYNSLKPGSIEEAPD